MSKSDTVSVGFVCFRVLCGSIILHVHSCEIHTSEQKNMHRTGYTYSGRVIRFIQFATGLCNSPRLYMICKLKKVHQHELMHPKNT